MTWMKQICFFCNKLLHRQLLFYKTRSWAMSAHFPLNNWLAWLNHCSPQRLLGSFRVLTPRLLVIWFLIFILWFANGWFYFLSSSWASSDDVWIKMLNKELKYVHDKSYLQRHPKLQPKMRAILLDWLLEVRTELKRKRLWNYSTGVLVNGVYYMFYEHLNRHWKVVCLVLKKNPQPLQRSYYSITPM